MPRFAANLSMMFTEHPFLDRFQAAADAGFTAVEFLFPYDHPPEIVAKWREAAGVHQALFNLAPGNWDGGERGLASLPGREAEFEASVTQALDYADALDCPLLHVMAGIPGNAPAEAATATYRRNLTLAADRAAARGRSICIEPINARDMPGFFLRTTTEAIAHLDDVARPNAHLQLDLYHCQISEGDLAKRTAALLPRVAHVQIAGVPERHEPSLGEINYPYLFALLDRLGYDGWVGCEYRPEAGTVEGLGWFAAAQAG
ncbi:MAG: 2-oxo-tetronate isomerase [Pseudomonadota bacterium]